MQFELFAAPRSTSAPRPVSPASEIEGAPATHLTALLAAARPLAMQLARLAIRTWPARDVQVDDLSQDLLVDVMQRASGAPMPATARHVWLSTTMTASLAARWSLAKRQQATELAVRQRAEQTYAKEGFNGTVLPLDMPSADAGAMARVEQVLARLTPADATMLRDRVAGVSWRALAAQHQTSVRTIARRYAAAVARARTLAADLDDEQPTSMSVASLFGDPHAPRAA